MARKLFITSFLVLFLASLLLFTMEAELSQFAAALLEQVLRAANQLANLASQFVSNLVPPLLWILFIVAGGIISVVGWSKRPTHPDLQASEDTSLVSPGRLQLLLTDTQLAFTDWQARIQLAQRLQVLTVKVIAGKLRIPPEEIRQALLAGRLNLPEDIQSYLRAALDPPRQPPGLHLFHWYISLPWIMRSSPLDLDPQKVVSFLENELDGR